MLCKYSLYCTCPHYSSYKEWERDNGCMCDYCIEELEEEDTEDDADK